MKNLLYKKIELANELMLRGIERMINFKQKRNNVNLKSVTMAILGLAAICNTMIAEAVLPSNATLSITPATNVCLPFATGTFPNCIPSNAFVLDGSFLDMSGKGQSVLETNNGIILGTAQPASGSHTGLPDGTETPGMDKPWVFVGSTGLHQTLAGSGGITIINNTGAGGNAANEVTLDFSAWTVSWNGIEVIPLGTGLDPVAPRHSDCVAAGLASGQAAMTCGATCGDGDTYDIVYCATVPIGSGTGFDSVRYTLRLRGLISTPAGLTTDKTINLAGNPATIAAAVGSTDGRVTEAELISQGVTTDAGFTNTGGFFNFRITATGGTPSRIVLPITPATIPANAVYRKWNGTQWITFTADGTNLIASAALVGGTCPAVGNVAYVDANGLVEGHDCIRLTIQEDGPYDLNTGSATVVEDPGGVGVGVGVFVDTRTSGTSGCSISKTPVNIQQRADWWLLAGFITWLGLMIILRRKRQS